jgi:hypothetical protein
MKADGEGRGEGDGGGKEGEGWHDASYSIVHVCIVFTGDRLLLNHPPRRRNVR